MCGGGVTTSGSLFHSVTMQTMPSFSHWAASPTAALLAVYCSKFSGTMKMKKSPSAYRYCISVSTTSAASSESPDFQLRSSVRPVLRLRILMRLKAWPLPGFTNSFSTMAYGSPSIENLHATADLGGRIARHVFSSR